MDSNRPPRGNLPPKSSTDALCCTSRISTHPNALISLIGLFLVVFVSPLLLRCSKHSSACKRVVKGNLIMATFRLSTDACKAALSIQVIAIHLAVETAAMVRGIREPVVGLALMMAENRTRRDRFIFEAYFQCTNLSHRMIHCFSQHNPHESTSHFPFTHAHAHTSKHTNGICI